MNNVVFSLIVASIIGFFVLIFNNKENENKDKTGQYFQISIISFICIYLGLIYLYGNDTIYDIHKGDAPF
jgi:uncharacterized membrane protein